MFPIYNYLKTFPTLWGYPRCQETLNLLPVRSDVTIFPVKKMFTDFMEYQVNSLISTILGYFEYSQVS